MTSNEYLCVTISGSPPHTQDWLLNYKLPSIQYSTLICPKTAQLSLSSIFYYLWSQVSHALAPGLLYSLPEQGRHVLAPSRL